MKELAGRLAAYDPEIGDAVRVISYFDELAAHRGGLESIVRGAAVLAGAPARLVIDGRRVALRVLADGRREDPTLPCDNEWPSSSIPDLGATLWLERSPTSQSIDAMILERATIAVRAVLDRTQFGRHATFADDLALVEVIVDSEADPAARDQAARTLGLKPGQLIRAVSSAGRQTELQIITPGTSPPGFPRDVRAGVGPTVPVEEAPTSAREAALALRFAAEVSPGDPGPCVVYSDDLGVLTILAGLTDRGCTHPDLTSLKSFINHGPAWLLETLNAVSTTESHRAAARALIVHHSTLQNRLLQVSKSLGWDVTTPNGKLRLQIALLLWRLTAT